MADNNIADVTNVKGVQGGYGFSAPASTTPPEGFTTLSAAFDNMGFISSDGIEESVEADTEEVTDLNGDVIFVLKSKEKEKLVLTLVSLTKESLSEWYGHANVDDTPANYMKVSHKATDHATRVYAFDLLLKDGRKMRKVVPCGQVTEVGPVTVGAGNVYAREITINCAPDSDGVRIYDYFEKETGETGATGA